MLNNVSTNLRRGIPGELRALGPGCEGEKMTPYMASAEFFDSQPEVEAVVCATLTAVPLGQIASRRVRSKDAKSVERVAPLR